MNRTSRDFSSKHVPLAAFITRTSFRFLKSGKLMEFIFIQCNSSKGITWIESSMTSKTSEIRAGMEKSKLRQRKTRQAYPLAAPRFAWPARNRIMPSKMLVQKTSPPAINHSTTSARIQVNRAQLPPNLTARHHLQIPFLETTPSLGPVMSFIDGSQP